MNSIHHHLVPVPSSTSGTTFTPSAKADDGIGSLYYWNSVRPFSTSKGISVPCQMILVVGQYRKYKMASYERIAWIASIEPMSFRVCLGDTCSIANSTNVQDCHSHRQQRILLQRGGSVLNDNEHSHSNVSWATNNAP
mmetsp:Transcript_43597/g.79710  ORF Transcript_43597/g.79710 Transcript_43597/m.79710 type:complete len:138 (-) Transcript_43597:1049-1462(-)